MSDLKPCPRCKKCKVGSKTELVNTVDGVFFKCLWCEELTNISVDNVGQNVVNQIKSDAIMESANDILGYAGLTDYYNQFIERANKLEEGKL